MNKQLNKKLNDVIKEIVDEMKQETSSCTKYGGLALDGSQGVGTFQFYGINDEGKQVQYTITTNVSEYDFLADEERYYG